MTDTSHDRLIFNRAGESVRAIPVPAGGLRYNSSVRVQCTAINPPTLSTPIATTVEIVIDQREAVAFALQILTMVGYAAEVMPSRSIQAGPKDMLPLSRSTIIKSTTEQGFDMMEQHPEWVKPVTLKEKRVK